ncbi:MAG: MmgE/PrpD family protein [Nitriliruptoraceae bacterium]
MGENVTEPLATFAAELTYDDLPVQTRDYVKKLLFDSVACALASSFSDEVPEIAGFARDIGAEGDSTVIGESETLSLIGASLLNAYLITAVTVCDVYSAAHVHVTPEIIPPTLAIAERDRASGRQLVTALAAGLESAVRVADGMNYPVARTRGWHMPGIVGPFGAAAGVGQIVGLDAGQMRNAFGLAGTQSAGTWASWGTPAVKFHQARGAVSGLLAGLLATHAFPASADILGHEDGGIYHAYAPEPKPEAVADGLGTRWALEGISLRLWPGGTPLQAALTALFEVKRAKPDLALDDISQVHMAIAPGVFDAHNRFVRPEGTFDALLSFHYAAAQVLSAGTFWMDDLEARRFLDPTLQAFMADRVTLEGVEGETPDSCELTITLTSGETLHADIDAATGHPRNPASIEELTEKFRRCADGRLSDTETDALIETLRNVEELDDVTELFAQLRR